MRMSKDLVAASAAPMVLAILAEGESYGYAIVSRVREVSDGAFEWTDGLLYPLLHRLEGSGLVSSRWGQADTGRKRRYYEITDAGRAELVEHRRQWASAIETMRKALGGIDLALPFGSLGGSTARGGLAGIGLPGASGAVAGAGA